MTVNYTHSDDLINASRNIHGLDETLPFGIQLVLKGRQHSLQCQEIYRVLPGRRITLRAVLDGVSVVVKLYLGASQKLYWQRELSGVNILAASVLQTPRLLHYESDLVSGLSYLVFEYITPLASDRVAELEQKVFELSSLLAQMHNQGIVQNDLHLNNFLFGEKGIYLIDGDAIKKFVVLSPELALENMAVLLAQLNCAEAVTSQRCLDTYLPLRDKSVPVNPFAFHQRVEKLRNKRLRSLLTKAQRNCSAYYSTSSMKHFFVCTRKSFNTDMQSILADLDGWVERGECLKDGNTCTVSRVCINDRSYVIKRYNIKSVWHGLGRTFRTTRARVSWLNSQILGFYGIPTAPVLALFEERKGPLRGRAFLIMENLDGALLSQQKQPLSQEIRLAAFSLFRKLFGAGLVHSDTKSSNFIVLNDAYIPVEAELAVIDLDGMKKFAKDSSITSDRWFRKAFEKDVQRFLKNFDTDPELAAGLSINALSVSSTDCSV